MIRLTYLFLLALCVSCGTMQRKDASLSILKYAKTDLIPSASGIEYCDGNLVVTGDDSPYLHFLNANTWKIEAEHQIAPIDSMVGNRMYYKTKPDFEGVSSISVNGYKHILVVGSGSKRKYRDSCVVFDDGKKLIAMKVNLRPLYDAFRDSLNFTQKQRINIEGIAADKKRIFFVHRGNSTPPNTIFELTTPDFLMLMRSSATILPKFKVHRIQLPEIDGEKAGLSGIDMHEKGLLLCASVEVSKDPLRDGEILGSFVAYVPFSELNSSKINFIPVYHDGKRVKTKIESVAIKTVKAGKIVFLAASDNDDGSSEFFEMEMEGLPTPVFGCNNTEGI